MLVYKSARISCSCVPVFVFTSTHLQMSGQASVPMHCKQDRQYVMFRSTWGLTCICIYDHKDTDKEASVLKENHDQEEEQQNG